MSTSPRATGPPVNTFTRIVTLKEKKAVTHKGDPSDSKQPSKTGENTAENEQNKDLPVGEEGVAESTTEEVQCDPQMGASTLESLKARDKETRDS